MAVVLSLLLAAGLTVDLARYASAADGRLLPGTVIGEIPVGGLLPQEALERLTKRFAPLVERTVTVRHGTRTWTRSAAELGVTTDLEQQLDAAIAAAEVGLLDRARARYLRRAPGPQLDVSVTEPTGGVRRLVTTLADELDRDVVDATLDYDRDGLRIVPHQVGVEVDRVAAEAAILAALERADDTATGAVRLPVTRLAPDTTTDDFGQILFLDQSEHRLDLYLDGRHAHSYTVTTGTGRYPTPRGEFEITQKRYLPTWVNPAPNGWGRGMPRSIAPGPRNPLGLRALNWSIGAIRFHGTADVDNLGRDASHGCVRLSNADIVHLYDLVEVGARIISVR